MPVPRIFVSSTCYDLKDFRYNLRNLLLDYSFDPVMSEFGDIFFEFDKHVQDSCIKEIEKCQMFILIVGNNYGSIYHKSELDKEIPDSNTLKEFEKSISYEIPKFMFIEKFVDYDYINYKKSLEKLLKEYFKNNDIKDQNEVENKVKELRTKFDLSFPFSQEQYKFIFYFLDIIYNLNINNARFIYENFEDIKTQLKKQWAGYIYKQLIEEKIEKNIDLNNENLKNILIKTEKIEKILEDSFILDKGNKGKISFDVKKIKQVSENLDINKETEVLDTSLDNIVNALYTNEYNFPISRGHIKEKITIEKVRIWLDSLNDLIKEFKWSKTIPFTDLFKYFHVSYFKIYNDTINKRDIINISNIYNQIKPEEKSGFYKVILKKLNKLYEEPVLDKVIKDTPKNDNSDVPPDDDIPDDDIPF